MIGSIASWHSDNNDSTHAEVFIFRIFSEACLQTSFCMNWKLICRILLEAVDGWGCHCLGEGECVGNFNLVLLI